MFFVFLNIVFFYCLISRKNRIGDHNNKTIILFTIFAIFEVVNYVIFKHYLVFCFCYGGFFSSILSLSDFLQNFCIFFAAVVFAQLFMGIKILHKYSISSQNLFKFSFCLYGGGWIFWISEQYFCSYTQPFQFHAIWKDQKKQTQKNDFFL